jgi:DNA-binding NarL/FixJ family response regulator
VALGVDATVTKQITVQIVDDHESTAVGLAALLVGHERFEFLDPVRRVEDVDPSRAPVVVCDLHLPGSLSGPSAVAHLVNDLSLSVVASTGIASPTVIANAIGAGAYSFVSKDGPFPAHVWIEAISAAADELRLVTARLAEALLADLKLRPLVPEHDLTSQAHAFLRAVLSEADSALTKRTRNAKDANVKQLTRQIWRTTSERHNRYSIYIPWDLRAAGALLRQGMSWADVAGVVTVKERTLTAKTADLQTVLANQVGVTSSPLFAMKPSMFLIHILELGEASGTILPAERIRFEKKAKISTDKKRPAS